MARTSEKLKAIVGVIFSTSNRSNSKIKLKTFKNKTIDDLIDCNFITPGIPEKANIKEVIIGENHIKYMAKKYNIVIL
jgi:hypothetical protein